MPQDVSCPCEFALLYCIQEETLQHFIIQYPVNPADLPHSPPDLHFTLVWMEVLVILGTD